MSGGRTVERSARVILRRPSPNDEREFLDRVHASRSLHDPWSYPPDTPESFAVFVQRSHRPDTETLLMCRVDDDAIAGVFNLSQIFYGSFCNAFLGYYGFVPFAGRGYMHEGIRLVQRHAFGTLGLHRLQANIQPGNEASIALVRAAGFRKEGLSTCYLKIAGRWRDHENWAMLGEDLVELRARADVDDERGS